MNKKLTPTREAIDARRKLLGMSKMGLADKSETHRPSLSRFLNGKQEVGSDTIDRLIWTLGGTFVDGELIWD